MEKGKTRAAVILFIYFTQSLTPYQPQTNTNKQKTYSPDVTTCHERAGPEEWKRCQKCCRYLPEVVSLAAVSVLKKEKEAVASSLL